MKKALAGFAFAALATACGVVGPSEDAGPGTGRVDVVFSGLPGPWADRGVVALDGTGPAGFVFDRSDSYADVPSGDYTATVEPILLCDATYEAASPTSSITVAPDGTTQLIVAYAKSVAVGPSGFRARVTGVHSNSGPVELTADAFESGGDVIVFGCLRSWNSGTVHDPTVRIGHHRDVLVEDAPVLAELEVFDEPCSVEAEDADPWCTMYFGGRAPFGAEAGAAATAGLMYVSAWVNTLPTGILATPLTSTDAAAVLAGGSLRVEVDTEELPGEARDGVSVCIEGPFRFDWNTALLDGEVCVGSGEHVFSDLLSGTYRTEVFGIDGLSTYTVLVAGDPAEVRPGVTASIEVRFAGP